MSREFLFLAGCSWLLFSWKHLLLWCDYCMVGVKSGEIPWKGCDLEDGCTYWEDLELAPACLLSMKVWEQVGLIGQLCWELDLPGILHGSLLYGWIWSVHFVEVVTSSQLKQQCYSDSKFQVQLYQVIALIDASSRKCATFTFWFGCFFFCFHKIKQY